MGPGKSSQFWGIVQSEEEGGFTKIVNFVPSRQVRENVCV